jgi:hypothetical protein
LGVFSLKTWWDFLLKTGIVVVSMTLFLSESPEIKSALRGNALVVSLNQFKSRLFTVLPKRKLLRENPDCRFL